MDLEQENSLRMQEVKPSPESSKSKSPSAVGSPPKKGAEDREKISNFNGFKMRTISPEEAHDVNSFLHADSATLEWEH